MSLDTELLRKRINAWKAKLAQDSQRAVLDKQERADRVICYQAQTADKFGTSTKTSSTSLSRSSGQC